MKNKFFKFMSTVLVAILIISIAPMNEAVVSEMKSSTNSVIKNIGEAVENIDFTLPEFDVKAEAGVYDSFECEVKYDKALKTLTIVGSGIMPSYDTSVYSVLNPGGNIALILQTSGIGLVTPGGVITSVI